MIWQWVDGAASLAPAFLGGALAVRRYVLPKLRALNFVIVDAPGGAVTVLLAQDMHGMSLSFLMLSIELTG
jgi:hypothetical protein